MKISDVPTGTFLFLTNDDKTLYSKYHDDFKNNAVVSTHVITVAEYTVGVWTWVEPVQTVLPPDTHVLVADIKPAVTLAYHDKTLSQLATEVLKIWPDVTPAAKIQLYALQTFQGREAPARSEAAHHVTKFLHFASHWDHDDIKRELVRRLI